MKIGRLGPLGQEIPVAVAAGATFDLRPLTQDIDGAFLAKGGPALARALLLQNALPELAGASALRIGSPIARPGAVVCVGMNYAAHARESGSEPPMEPVIFFKHPSSLTGPDDDVHLPPGAVTVDWEVELAIVIGKRTTPLASISEASAHIAGFTISDDLSERTYQIERSGGQWSKGKSFPGFNPIGPWLVTPDEVDVADLRMESFVNGGKRQDSSTADMIFSPAELVVELSKFMTLEPGDVINTGTPQGVALSGRFPYLRAEDLVETRIVGLGQQRHRVVASSSQTEGSKP